MFSNLSLEQTPAGQEGYRVVIPLLSRQNILVTLHEYHSSGESMIRLAKNCLFWPTMKSDLVKLYESCTNCQINRRAKINPPPIPKLNFAKLSPMDSLNIDFAQYGSKNFIAAADRCSGFVMASPTSNQSTASALQFVHTIGANYGYPSKLRSDNGPAFREAFTKELENMVFSIRSLPLMSQPVTVLLNVQYSL